MKKNSRLDTSKFPKEAIRKTKSDGTKVWVYRGKEYKSKRELIELNKLA